jgi:hypothetical protein
MRASDMDWSSGQCKRRSGRDDGNGKGPW